MGADTSTLLVVDDEASVRKLLRRLFVMESYKVVEAHDRQSTLDILNSETVDLITLDVNLDGEDGLELLREIRANSIVPIIMVSGKGELIDTVVGLEVGADDYICKPFEHRDVLARVKSALRRSKLNQQTPMDQAPDPAARYLSFGDFTLDESTRDLTASDGMHHSLTTAEYDLLFALVSHPQQIMSRDQLMDVIKGSDWHPTDRSIDNQIARLRKKLDTLGIDNAITTVRGIGYQFSLPVQHH